MRVFSRVSAYIFILVALILGVRLLLMWRRTRKLPELLFALGFLVGGVGSTGFFVLNSHHRGIIPKSLLAASAFAALFFNSASASVKVIAVWRIFRPDRTWAKVVTAIIGSIIAGQFLGATTGHGLPRAWEWIGQVSAFGWMAGESFRYWALLRRRQRLGLGDPVVTNRLWLWGCSGTSIAVMWTLFGLIRWFPPLGNPFFMTLHTGVLGLTSSLMSWLAFYPPHAYLRFIGPARPRPLAA